MNKSPGSEQEKKIFISTKEEETFLIAKSLGEKLDGNEIILLSGELGAGKTVFARGIAAGLGLDDIGQVCSPSFTLINIYQARVPVIHMDLYRLETQSEILDLGWEDYINTGVIIVEWAEKMNYPSTAIQVTIEVDEENRRTISIIQK